jgi:type II secretion system protein N
MKPMHLFYHKGISFVRAGKLLNSALSLRGLFLLCYVMAVLALLLYLRFPGEDVRRYAEARVAAMVPGGFCRVVGPSYRFPRTITMQSLQFGLEDRQAWQGEIRDLAVTVGSVLPPYKLEVEGSLYGGRLEAEIAVYSARELEIGELRLTDIDLAALPREVFAGRRQLTGRLDIAGAGRLRADGRDKLSGQGQLSLRDGSVSLLQPVLSLQQLHFSRLSCSLQVVDDGITIGQGVLQGSDLHADFSGSWQAAGGLDAGMVLLRGRLRPQADLLQSRPEQRQALDLLVQHHDGWLPFEVAGTLRYPILRFLP